MEFKIPTKKHLLAILGILITTLAFAIVYGPFRMSVFYPSVRSFEEDSGGNFVAAANLPRNYMLSNVSKINKGDIVRIIYESGEVYDFEVSARCAKVGSLSCPYLAPVKKAGPNAKAHASRILMAEDRRLLKDSCVKGEATTIEYKTGYWASKHPETGSSSVVVTNAGWVNTGSVFVTYGPNKIGCK